MEHWSKWHWDYIHMPEEMTLKYSSVKRWRRGWVTLYKLTSQEGEETVIDWRLYLPFNVNVGIQVIR